MEQPKFALKHKNSVWKLYLHRYCLFKDHDKHCWLSVALQSLLFFNVTAEHSFFSKSHFLIMECSPRKKIHDWLCQPPGAKKTRKKVLRELFGRCSKCLTCYQNPIKNLYYINNAWHFHNLQVLTWRLMMTSLERVKASIYIHFFNILGSYNGKLVFIWHFSSWNLNRFLCFLLRTHKTEHLQWGWLIKTKVTL
jgi:hypothetical protein